MATTVTVSGSDSTTLTLTSSAENFYVNGTAVENGSIAKTVNKADGVAQYFSVIAQTGNKEASIRIVKVVFE